MIASPTGKKPEVYMKSKVRGFDGTRWARSPSAWKVETTEPGRVSDTDTHGELQNLGTTSLESSEVSLD
jgi:hypothetical protein